MAELKVFNEVRGTYPILILDDLFSELDRFKINNILNLIDYNVQTFITTTDIDKINDNLKNNIKTIIITFYIKSTIISCYSISFIIYS